MTTSPGESTTPIRRFATIASCVVRGLRGASSAAPRIGGHRRSAWVLALAWLAFGAMAPAVRADQLTVSAAASLTDAFKEIAQRFEAARPGTTVRLNFAASGVLLQQMAQGAPVDVFASADQDTMDRAAAQRLIAAGSRRDFAANALVLIEPAEGALGLRGVADLADARVRRIAVGKPATVPVGRYTRQALDRAGLWSAVEPRLVQADSVRQVLDYVARGEADAGFVYRSDAASMPSRVRVVATVEGHDPVRYPAAVVVESPRQPLAQQFVDALGQPEARAVLVRLGFGVP